MSIRENDLRPVRETPHGRKVDSRELERMARALERSSAVGGGLVYGDGTGYRIDAPDLPYIYAKLTDYEESEEEPTRYKWSQVIEDGEGGWLTPDGLLAGTIDEWPAYEANGDLIEVTDEAPVFVKLYFGYGPWMTFWAPDSQGGGGSIRTICLDGVDTDFYGIGRLTSSIRVRVANGMHLINDGATKTLIELIPTHSEQQGVINLAKQQLGNGRKIAHEVGVSYYNPSSQRIYYVLGSCETPSSSGYALHIFPTDDGLELDNPFLSDGNTGVVIAGEAGPASTNRYSEIRPGKIRLHYENDPGGGATGAQMIVNGSYYINNGGSDIQGATGTLGPGATSVGGIITHVGFGSFGTGSVTSVTAGTGLSASPNPITTSGTISLSTPVSLLNGGTGASLSDPGFDRILYWDENEDQVTWLTVGSGLEIDSGALQTVGSGTITEISQGSGIICTPDPITDTGTISADFGSISGKVCEGDDPRLSDTRDPNAHEHSAADITSGTLDTARMPTQGAVSDVTDNTGGTDNSSMSAVSGTGDDTTINDNLAHLAAIVNALLAELRSANLIT